MQPDGLLVAFPSLLVATVLATLGVVLFLTRPRDLANRVLSGFVLTVAVNYLLVGLHLLQVDPAAPPQGSPLLVAAMAVQVVEPFFLVVFAGIYPARDRLASPTVLLPLFVVCVVALGVLALRPRLVIEHLSPLRPLYDGYVNAVYVVVLVLMIRRQLAAPAGGRLPFRVLLGLSILVIHRMVLTFPARYVSGAPLSLPLGVGTLANSVIALAILVLAARALGPYVAPDRRAELRLLAALTGGSSILLSLPLVLADLPMWLHAGWARDPPEMLLAVRTLITNSAFPSRWLVFAALAGPAFLADQVVHVESRIRRALAVAFFTSALLAIAVAAIWQIQGTITSTAGGPGKIIVVSTLAGLAGVQAVLAGRWLGHRLLPAATAREEAARYLRRIEVYRAAERAAANGRLDAAALERLRERLALDEADLRVLRSGEPHVVPLGPGATLVGRYHLEGLIGRGSHGRVFRARDLVTGGTVAIKELAPASEDDEVAARLAHEAIASARLDHARIVPVLEQFLHGRSAFLVMPLLERSLEDLLASGAPPEARLAQVFDDALDALAAAHGAGILHRDIKPANILLDRQGRAYLSDFGVALLDDLGVTVDDVAPSVAGTPGYLPPEAILGEGASPSWDLYAMGVTIRRALVRASAQQPLPPAMDEFLARALAEDPSERFRSAEQMREALRRAWRQG